MTGIHMNDVLGKERTPRLPDTVGWKYWQQTIAGKKATSPLGIVPIGFYRSYARRRDIWWPVAVWVDDHKDPLSPKYYQFGDAPKVLIESKEEEEIFDHDVFKHLVAIKFEDYEFWKKNREWPVAWGLHAPKKEHKPEFTDLSEVTSELGADPINERAVPGDNSGATEEEIDKLTAEAFKDQVASVIALFDKEHATIASKAQGEIATGLRARLTALASQGDSERETEKKPHLEAGRAVDDKWNPTIREARAKAKAIQAAVSAFGAEEKRRLDAEHKARVAAELEAGNVPMEKPPEVVFQGPTGRKSTMTEYVDIEIVDHDEVYRQLRNNPELKALMLALVKRAHSVAKAEFKGAKYTTRMAAT